MGLIQRKMRAVLLVIALGCVAFASKEVENEFRQFKAKFNKVYASQEEERMRFKIFEENYLTTLSEKKSLKPYTTGITQFSDLTHQEFKDNYLGLKRHSVPSGAAAARETVRSASDLPDSVNWVEKGAVSPVKNQGRCGSCWAFAVTEQIESYYAIASGELIDLSAQQVTSCSPNALQCGGSGGCKGSVTQLGFNYLQLFGMMSDADYPYVSGDTSEAETCVYDPSLTQVGLTGYDTLPANNHDAVMAHLAEVGPLSIAVDASVWHTYTGGVFTGCPFDENISINHGVQLVGYGSDFSALGVYDYWLVRNSWGESWGENGFIKLLRTQECGVNSTPMDGTACVNGPGTDMQTVCGMCGMLLDPSYPLGVHKL